jgi:polyhydroxybutyrate depolymerase
VKPEKEKSALIAMIAVLLLASEIAVFFVFEVPAFSGPQTSKGNDHAGSMIHNGLERTYRIHIPSSHDKSKPMPMVIALHGGGGTGEKMEKHTLGGFNTLSDKEGFIVVYPDGIEKHWNDGRKKVRYRAHREKIDDIGFISALIDELVKQQNIDNKRIYITGISNGAMLSNRLACELTGKITAIAPVAGNMPYDLAPHCSPSKPIPVLMINGTKDPMMPWEGGEASFGRLKFGRVLSAMETIQFWVAHNQCLPIPVITWEPDTDPQDGTRVRKEAYNGCKDGTDVILYAIENGGHTWPGGSQYMPEMIVGKTSRDIDANEVIWSFFER